MRRPALLPILVLAVAAIAGCGGDDDAASVPGGDGGAADADLEVIAEDISFPQDSYTAEAGEVSIVYRNAGNIRHTLLVRDGGGDVEGFELDVASNGDVDQGSVDLEPGEYELYCDVPGHEAAGMVANFVVE